MLERQGAAGGFRALLEIHCADMLRKAQEDVDAQKAQALKGLRNQLNGGPTAQREHLLMKVDAQSEIRRLC